MDYTRALKVAVYFNENDSSTRKTGKHFGIHHSTVHRYLRKVYPNPESEKILEANKVDYRFGGQKHPVK